MNENNIELLNLLFKEYGYNIKLDPKSYFLRKKTNDILEFFDYFNIDYTISDSILELPCLINIDTKYFIMNEKREIREYANTLTDIGYSDVKYISIEKLSKQHLLLFNKRYFMKEILKYTFSNKLDLLQFCLLSMVQNVIIWLLSFLLQYTIDELIINNATLMAIKYYIWILVLIFLLKILYDMLRKISNRNNCFSNCLKYKYNEFGLGNLFYSILEILFLGPFCIYIIYSINRAFASLLVLQCFFTLLLIFWKKMNITSNCKKILYSMQFIFHFISYIPYIVLTIIIYTYQSISFGYFCMITIIYFVLISRFIFIEINLYNFIESFYSMMDIFLSKVIQQTSLEINYSIENRLTIKNYKNLNNIRLDSSKIYLFYGKSNSGKSYLAKNILGLKRDPMVQIYLDKYKIINLNKKTISQYIGYIGINTNYEDIILSSRKLYYYRDVRWFSDFISLPFLELINSLTPSNILLHEFKKETDTNQFLIILVLLILQNKSILIFDGLVSYFDNTIITKILEIKDKYKFRLLTNIVSSLFFLSKI